jgi:amino acid adenylation domain-containing protein/non-ribosomal peptide synthase protein (TIGR01720 family)
MKNIAELIADLNNLDIKLWMEGDRLRCNAPKDKLTPVIKAELAERKAEILAFINNANNSNYSPAIIQALPRSENLALSFAQQRLWFIGQFESGSSLYNLPTALRVKGELNVPILCQTLNEIVQRHESLRTSFVSVENQPVQVITPSLNITLPIVDLQGLSAAKKEAEVLRLIANEVQQPFNLAQAPLLRSTLLRLSGVEHIVMFTMHHIISDGWSMEILTKELAVVYEAFCNGQISPLPELPIQYADFAAWQRQWLTGAVLESQLDYWQKQLAGAPELLELPLDYPRPAVQSFQGATHCFELSPELSVALKILSQQEGTTLFMTLLAAFKTLLHRYTGTSDLVIGSPIANRNRREIEQLIGFFVNTLVLRTDLSGDPSFSELLRRVKEVALGAYAHQDVPFEQVVEKLQPQRSLSHSPLFQVMFVLQNAQNSDLQLSGLTLESLEVEQKTAMFDLTLTTTETASGLMGVIEYSTDLFAAKTIHSLAEHFQILLWGIIANPQQKLSRLPLLTEAEKRQLLIEWNDTQVDYPQDECIHHLFEAQVERTPDAIAIIGESQQLTYCQLNKQANQLAHYLQKQGVKPETLVGICLERSPLMFISILAILKAGGAYLPLDPNYPPERLNYILTDAKINLLLTQSPLTHQFSGRKLICLDTDGQVIATESSDNPLGTVQPSNLAYSIYTSGSTGTPKGVMLQHNSVVNFVTAAVAQYQITKSDRILQFASMSFDAAVEEIYPGLISGGTLVLRTEAMGYSLSLLLQQCRNYGITILDLPTAFWHSLVTELESNITLKLPESIRLVIIGGEAVNPDQVAIWNQLVKKSCQLINTYGPTETTVVATSYKIPSQRDNLSSIPIGKPLPNLQTYILDHNLQPVPIGVWGELYIGGVGLARDYWKRPDLTAEKFIPDPFSGQPGARLYRTGDLVCYLPDGNLQFLGRVDNQVKIRGFRVELGEIESVLRQHLEIREALVLAGEKTGRQHLVAYIVPTQEDAPLVLGLRQYLESKLPQYLIPSSFRLVKEFPLTPSGKIDRLVLPQSVSLSGDAETPYQEAITPIEQQLVNIWQEVLGLEQVGINDNFFELGGDSIISLQVISKANQVGLRLTPKQLFQHQTIAQLAMVTNQLESISAEQGLVAGTFPLTPIQKWFFAENFSHPHHFNQSVMLDVPSDIDVVALKNAIAQLISHHDLLRVQFQQVESRWQPLITPAWEIEAYFTQLDLMALPQEQVQSTIEDTAESIQGSLNLSTGQIFRAVWFNLGNQRTSRLLLVIHHLVVDGVSWRILLEDLQNIYDCLKNGQAPQLPAKTTSFSQWAERLTSYASSEELRSQLTYWLTTLQQPVTSLPLDYPEGENSEASSRMVSVALKSEETTALLQEVPATYQTQINDVLLTALVQSFTQSIGCPTLLFDLEGHGRESLFEDVDLARTVGWFTSIFPVILNLAGIDHPGEALKTVKEQLRAIPNRGIGYGILRYLSQESAIIESLSSLPQAEICFNYLGQFAGLLTESSSFKLASESSGNGQSQRNHRSYVLEIDSLIVNGCLQINWTYSQNLHQPSTIESLAENYLENLRSLINHCQSPEAGGFTPTDFAEFQQSQWSQNDLEAITAVIRGM